MPALANPRHERFAQELAKGKSQSAAYETAGYKPSKHHASRLATHGNVQARVAELQGRAAAKTEVTLASLLEEAEEIRAKALEANQFGAAIAAVKEKGVLSGHRVEKRENRNINLNDMSDDELAAIATGSREGTSGEARRPPLAH